MCVYFDKFHGSGGNANVVNERTPPLMTRDFIQRKSHMNSACAQSLLNSALFSISSAEVLILSIIVV